MGMIRRLTGEQRLQTSNVASGAAVAGQKQSFTHDWFLAPEIFSNCFLWGWPHPLSFLTPALLRRSAIEGHTFSHHGIDSVLAKTHFCQYFSSVLATARWGAQVPR